MRIEMNKKTSSVEEANCVDALTDGEERKKFFDEYCQNYPEKIL